MSIVVSRSSSITRPTASTSPLVYAGVLWRVLMPLRTVSLGSMHHADVGSIGYGVGSILFWRSIEKIRKMIIADMNTEDATCEAGPNLLKIKEQRKKMGCNAEEKYAQDRDKIAHENLLSIHFRAESHPLMKDRINKIYFSNPDILNELGCTNAGAKHCEN